MQSIALEEGWLMAMLLCAPSTRNAMSSLLLLHDVHIKPRSHCSKFATIYTLIKSQQCQVQQCSRAAAVTPRTGRPSRYLTTHLNHLGMSPLCPIVPPLSSSKQQKQKMYQQQTSSHIHQRNKVPPITHVEQLFTTMHHNSIQSTMGKHHHTCFSPLPEIQQRKQPT